MKRNPSCSIRRSLQFSPCPTLRPRDQPLPAEIVPCDLTIGREIFFSGRPSGKRQFSEQNDDDRLEAGDGFSQPTQGYLEGLQPPEIVGLPWRAETSVSRSRRKTSVLRPMISARTARIDDNLGRGTDGSNPPPSSEESATNRSRRRRWNAASKTRDRWFESISLQRGVRCEPDFWESPSIKPRSPRCTAQVGLNSREPACPRVHYRAAPAAP